MHGLLKLNEGEIMKKALSFLSVLIIMILFSGCTKIPEKTDIEELIGEISDEIANQCGNGITNEGEECDFEYIRSCSSYDPETVGPIKCENCFLDFSNCQLKESCNTSKCNSKGECKAIKYLDYEIYCDCFDNRTGEHCEYCSNYFHFDFDRECISDSICTEIGCELENQECFIDGNSSKCRCKHPWTGEKCDECLSSYYYSDGECKSRYCSSGELECDKYEKCFDGNGKPECVCAGKHQDPDDCSKCLHGYDFVDYGDFCINEKEADCQHNPDAAENSFDILKKVTVTYTDENGWTEPAFCKWACPDDSYFKDNKCNLTFIGTSEYDINYPIGVDRNGVLYGSNNYEIFSISGEVSLVYSVNSTIREGRFGPGNNIYLNTGGHGIIDTEKWTHLIFENLTTSSIGNMSILKNGKVTYGNSIIEKTERIKIDADYDFYSNVVSDSSGNIINVYANGLITFHDENLNLLWNREYQNVKFWEYPVLDNSGNAYIPCCNSESMNICIIDLATGDLSDRQIVLASNCNTMTNPLPSVSIGENRDVYVLQKGVLKVFNAENTLILDTQNLYSSSRSQYTVAPVITDNGYIYFSNNYKIICINKEGEEVWTYDKHSSYPKYFIHHDEILYVFYIDNAMLKFSAPGNLKGDWPQIFHDARLSSSLATSEFIPKPPTPVLVSPENGALVNKSSVEFEWENNDKSLEHLMTIEGQNYDEIIAGPDSIYSAVLEDVQISDSIIWKVASISDEGAVSIAQSEFSRVSESEIWEFFSNKDFRQAPMTVNSEDVILAGRSDDLVLISRKDNNINVFPTDKSGYYGAATNKKGSFFGLGKDGDLLFEIKYPDYYKEILLIDVYSLTIPMISECNDQMILFYDNGGYYYMETDIYDDLVYSFYDSYVNNSSPVVNSRGEVFIDKLVSVWGNLIEDDLGLECNQQILYNEFPVCSDYSSVFTSHKNQDNSYSTVILPGRYLAVVHNGEIITHDYSSSKCFLYAGTPSQEEWRTIATLDCSTNLSKLLVSSDGTFFTFFNKNIVEIRENEGVVRNERISNTNILDIALTEEGRLFVMTENKIMEIKHNADGANPYEWSQNRGNAGRTGSVKSDTCNIHAQITLLEPVYSSQSIPKRPLFKWDAFDPEGDALKYDFEIHSDSDLIYSENDITDKFFQLPVDLEWGKRYYWSIVAKDGESGNNFAKASFLRK